MSVRIAPSILSADFARLAEGVARAEAGGADWIHVDVMDGHFVPNLTIGPPVVAALRKVTELPLDVHLMIERPERYIDAFADAGADWLTVHQEASVHLHRTLQSIRHHGMRAGVSLNPATSVTTLEEVLADLDMVLVMSVNPGFGGQSFIPGSTAKVARVRSLLAEAGRPEVEIQVDGGIGPDTAGEVVEAGATVLVAGAAVFKGAGTVAENIAAIRAAAG
ncbi:MAG: ribulose-phosphate 3-epimerase [Gemmatimonadetes bacterium]|nr:ribulose-phosphate 3-epimerase [Gemmatimonadota bacterium]NIQ59572.1 ribulose-phosphate 3-epimerase [Gemmatimonadota bacterium]NIU79779.1 ribulose-phosphate 3-epimerase [Gammaproteobacteria bacterium]NIX48288.1 ribulose-phosphate 3-epimerase [Gemmatimonadota bacterium]NIY12730.1 ribulose-phosphate 3-epimerase [Gemmatimonadota bacterium]